MSQHNRRRFHYAAGAYEWMLLFPEAQLKAVSPVIPGLQGIYLTGICPFIIVGRSASRITRLSSLLLAAHSVDTTGSIFRSYPDMYCGTGIAKGTANHHHLVITAKLRKLPYTGKDCRKHESTGCWPGWQVMITCKAGRFINREGDKIAGTRNLNNRD